MKREFLMLAQTYTDQHIGGWFVSQKLDGIRAFWDGGISRGKPGSMVPWANIEKDTREHIATGLWSRHGKIIHAPDWWLDEMPSVPLDGELYIGLQCFQDTVSAVRKIEPIDSEWDRVYYMVIDRVPLKVIFQPGLIDTVNYKKVFRENMVENGTDIPGLPFKRSYDRMQKTIKTNDHIMLVKQEQLPYHNFKPVLDEKMAGVLEIGGEGLMLRDPHSYWEPVRSKKLLKMKPFKDDEAEIVGFEDGKGRLEGLVGALVVEWDGPAGRVQFKLSGMTDAERQWGFFKARSSENLRGDIVTFKYRELTVDGIPKEARFWRLKDSGD